MPIEFPDLPYALDALEPHISGETLEYHYGKHHRSYVENLNEAIKGTELAELPLEQIVRRAKGDLYNNAAQAWNHAFYWRCMSPAGGGEPPGALMEAVKRDFGSAEKLREQFTDAAGDQFGSGWAWLVQQADGKLAITSTDNADTPLTGDATPLLTCDVWEHAYYIDYRNARPAYLEAFWKVVDWRSVAARLA